MPPKPKFKASCANPRSKAQHHFYASSMAQWETSEDVGELVAKMKKSPYSFFVMMVPLPLAADYQIESYAPVVEGCVWLALYEVNHG
jgi:hypothetical protein